MSALPGRRLERALARAAGRAGVVLAIDRHEEQAWSSATFVGARHVLDARATSGEALSRWLAAIAPEQLAVPGHLVAELTLQRCVSGTGETRVRMTGTTVRFD